jgi:hypothetical protein
MSTCKGGWRGAETQQPSAKPLFKNTDLVDAIISIVLHDLPFSQNQGLKSADDYYIKISEKQNKILG